ncbi:acetoacetate decarboxylase family protein [Micromonospora sp. BL4]|uniref:acetoacetate decarboxylase family protein n=1 Tax=Micromonospora sp. BL4 TaxID=2478710 RepID=UPI001F3017B3|nr:acetoacetate decarboxylase family protein [Micromonospora sp. BL4]
MTDLVAPQLVVNSRMIYFGWVPADPEAVAALVPPGLKPAPNRQVFMNQYVVDDAAQTSGFGAYSLTYLGPDLSGVDAPDGVTPGRWWTHYFNSSPVVRAYAAARGVPATVGTTTIEVRGRRLVATTEADGVPVIRTTARVGRTGDAVNQGQLRYFTQVDGRLVGGNYPFVAAPVDPFEVESLEFLEPDHPVYALRPAEPLEFVWGFYSPRSSFAYPGGEFVLD